VFEDDVLWKLADPAKVRKLYKLTEEPKRPRKKMPKMEVPAVTPERLVQEKRELEMNVLAAMALRGSL
jgi:hypothetical protein